MKECKTNKQNTLQDLDVAWIGRGESWKEVETRAQRGIQFPSGKEVEEKWKAWMGNKYLYFIPAELELQIQTLVQDHWT